MYLNMKTTTIGDLMERRNQAVAHLLGLRRTQESGQTWLPAIADAVELQLVDFIEKCNSRIDQIEDDHVPANHKMAVQLAFNFLFEYTISQDELPF